MAPENNSINMHSKKWWFEVDKRRLKVNSKWIKVAADEALAITL